MWWCEIFFLNFASRFASKKRDNFSRKWMFAVSFGYVQFDWSVVSKFYLPTYHTVISHVDIVRTRNVFFFVFCYHFKVLRWWYEPINSVTLYFFAILLVADSEHGPRHLEANCREKCSSLLSGSLWWLSRDALHYTCTYSDYTSVLFSNSIRAESSLNTLLH